MALIRFNRSRLDTIAAAVKPQAPSLKKFLRDCFIVTSTPDIETRSPRDRLLFGYAERRWHWEWRLPFGPYRRSWPSASCRASSWCSERRQAAVDLRPLPGKPNSQPWCPEGDWDYLPEFR